MAQATDDPWQGLWEPFFLSHVLPLEEERAFRQYLAACKVPEGTSIQDLNAHYDAFLRQWEPGQGPLPSRHIEE